MSLSEVTNIAGTYFSDHGPLGQDTFSSQFNGVVIQPGEQYSFDLYTLIPGLGPSFFDPNPVFKPAPPGTYSVPYNVLIYNTTNISSAINGGAVQITVIPIPASLWMFISGTAWIMYAGVRRSNKSLKSGSPQDGAP